MKSVSFPLERHQNKYLYGMYCIVHVHMIHPHTFTRPELVRCHAALLSGTSSKQVKIQCKRVFYMVFCLVFKYIFYTAAPSIRHFSVTLRRVINS